MSLAMDGFWFCSEPGREEIRFRTVAGVPTEVVLTCRHGQWSGASDATLTTARHAHGYTFDPPAPHLEISP